MNSPASDSRDLILGRLALQKGIVSAEQLRQSLALQARAAEIGLAESLSEVFLKKGFATRGSIETLEREEAFARARIEEEAALAREAVSTGLASPEAAERALAGVMKDPGGPPLEDRLLAAGAVGPAGRDGIAALRSIRNRRGSRELLDAPDESGGESPGAGASSPERSATVADAPSTPFPSLPVPGPSGSLPGIPGAPGAENAPAGSAGRVVLGEYEVVREIGRGSMGVVYEAVQKSLSRRVALKVLPPELVMNEKRVRRFQIEAEAAAKLEHPGIVKVFGMGEQGGIHFFAMEYIEGRTFEDLVVEGDLPYRKVCKLICLAAEALEYAHGKGVIHRDIKPANVMIQPDGGVRVMDFGLARQEEGESSLTASGTVVGTPAYMSPEQAAGDKGKIDRRTDVYSLGATLYEMLTGSAPLDFGSTEGVHSVLRRILEEEPVPPQARNRKIPANLGTVVMKALARDPDRRYATAGEFRDDLERFLRGDPVSARPVGPLVRVWMKLLKRKALAALVALLLAAAAGVPALVFATRAQAMRDRPSDRLEEARRALAAGDAGRAVALAEVVRKSSSDPESAVGAQRILCEARLGGADDEALFASLARLRAMAGDGPEGRWALARLLERLLRRGRTSPALALAGRMADLFPAEEEGAAALEVRGDLLLAQGRLEEARRAFTTLAARGRGGEGLEGKMRKVSSLTPVASLEIVAEAFAAGDLDGDGAPEVAFGTGHDVAVYRRTGPGALAPAFTVKVSDIARGPVGCVEIADADGDGLSELVLAYGQDGTPEPGALEVWKWADGALRLDWRFPLEGRNTRLRPGSLLVADLDGDGRSEIALGEQFYGRRVEFFERGPGGCRPFSTWTNRPPPSNSDVTGLAAGRTGAELTQVAVALSHWNGYEVASIEREPGSDRFYLSASKAVGDATGVAMADLDGDGACEIVVSKWYTMNPVLFGPGKPLGEVPEEDVFVFRHRGRAFECVAGIDCAANLPGTGAKAVAAGDLDGDGKAEIAALIVSRSETGNLLEKLMILRLRGGRLETEEILRIDLSLSGAHSHLRMADADGDGKPEIVVLGAGAMILGFD